jgi:hypothetical protein
MSVISLRDLYRPFCGCPQPPGRKSSRTRLKRNTCGGSCLGIRVSPLCGGIKSGSWAHVAEPLTFPQQENVTVTSRSQDRSRAKGEMGEGEKGRERTLMDNPCRECVEIAQEYREAMIDFWTNASDETRDACAVMAKLTGCTKRDAANAEEKLRPFSSQELLRPAEENQTRIAAAIYRKCLHQHRTGHYVNVRNG